MVKLDAKTPVPLYEQLKNLLQSQISSGVYSIGERLPAEAELCSKYEVSRVTVRRALDDLVADGALERRQGKGTYVAPIKSHIQMKAFDTSAKGFMGSSVPGTVKHTRVISKKEYVCNEMEREALKLKENDRVYVYLRLMILDGVPFYLDRAIYPADRFASMFPQVQDDVSTYRILSEQYGINEMQTSREIRLTYATDEQAQLLDCPLGAPLFRMLKKVRDRNDAPVHLSYTYFVGDRVVFTSESVS